jgi:hypothetical protein
MVREVATDKSGTTDNEKTIAEIGALTRLGHCLFCQASLVDNQSPGNGALGSREHARCGTLEQRSLHHYAGYGEVQAALTL